VGVIDLVPTLLELAAVPLPENLHGVSLVPYLLGADPDRGPILLQLHGEQKMEAVVEWPYKLIWEVKRNRFSLYHLEKDPNEQHDLATEDLNTVSRLKETLRLMRYQISR
jgi:arylsulfatase A-like enzyme